MRTQKLLGASVKIYLTLGICKVCILIIRKISCAFSSRWRGLYQAARLKESVSGVVKQAEKFGATVGVAWYCIEFTYCRWQCRRMIGL